MIESQTIQLLVRLSLTGLATSCFGYAFAEMDSVNLWAPSNIVAGENYEGVVILDAGAKYGQTMMLSTNDPTIIKIPESITILPYSNHGIFPIKAIKEGAVTIFAATNGQIIQKSINVYSSSRVPEGLRIILPVNTTKAENMLGYVIATDSKGSPAPVSKDTKVNLNSTPLIQVNEDSLLIKSGSHLSKFSAKIKGSGKIFANAEGLKIGEHEIVKTQDVVTVRIAVAPNIILEDSKAYFFVWLEKDGKPYKPPYVVHAFLSSNNLDSIRFTARSDVKQYSDSILQISLTDGVGSGHVISGNSGSAVITANVDAFGSTQTSVVVGPVTIDKNFQPIESDKEEKLKEIEKRTPNVAFIWLYPTITDSDGYGVIALYNMNSTKNTSTHADTNSTSVSISSTVNRIVPVPLDGRTISLTSSGDLQHPNMLKLSESKEVLLQRGVGHNHALLFDVVGKSQGEYTVSASGPGLERYQSRINIMSSYHDLYQLKTTPIPTLPGSTQALAMVSIIDNFGALIDAQKTFAGPVEISVSSRSHNEKITITSQNSAIYSGNIVEASPTIFSSATLSPVEHVITPNGIAASVSIDAPTKAHITEKIPFTVHEIDSFGVPLRKINFTNISATPGITINGKYLEINNAGTEKIAAISKIGASNINIEAFANNLDFSIIPSGVTNRIGKEFELRITSDVKDIDVQIESPFPYKKIDELTYAITPDEEGHLGITFTAFKKGYTPSKSIFSVHAEKIVNIGFKAIGSDGKELNIEKHIEIGNVSKNIVTPYQGEFKSQFLRSQFPPNVVIGNHGYKLNNVVFEDQEFPDGRISNIYLNRDAQIIAKYDRMIKIDVENALGGGFYTYGQVVNLSVPPKDKLSFLVREVFDHWEGIPYHTENVSFIAYDDVRARAILHDDYLFLMTVFGFGVSSMMYFKLIWKKGISLRWYMQRFFSILKINNFDRLVFRRSHMKKTTNNSLTSDYEFDFDKN
ncbi:hypothetical protein [Candidatus Nitrosotenuis chungbukensis]|uniref:hypothetical protein n=1 Tax=Candidatus Nitrosotenuis chungbukensis TaxID=1353246 RepID=UPI0005B27CC9|nr:hypothetical protein [Candidatus Nitrosotenuis chungbukensis]